jgi:hypothetical protein
MRKKAKKEEKRRKTYETKERDGRKDIQRY